MYSHINEARIHATELPLKKIFCSEFEFFIPSYQRPYAWGNEEAETLFDTLYQSFKINEKMYFLGSIVLIKNIQQPRADVVDGQQRLTTLSILYACLMELITDEDAKQDLAIALKQRASRINGESAIYRLHLRERDRSFFEKYISNAKVQDLLSNNQCNSFREESQQNIYSNCVILMNKIREKLKNQNELIAFCEFLNCTCYMIVVSVGDRDSAFRIFSLLNSTGLDLLPTDIIKADIIGNITETDKEEYARKWEDMENQVSRNGFNDLFGHIRMIYVKKKAEKSLLDEFKNNVLSQQADAKKFIEEILEPYADIYCALKKNWRLNPISADKNYLMWLNKVDNSDWVPVALKYLSLFNHDTNAKSLFLKKLECLTSFLHITAQDVNQRINRYKKILDEIDLKNSPHLESIELTSEEKNKFREVLSGNVYIDMVPKRRNYLILRLDFALSDKSATIEYNPKSLTLEHVLPQQPEGTEWEITWPDETEREKWLHKLGNIVPLNRKANSAARNFSFKEKKEKYFTNPKTKTSSYSLTTRVLNYESWTIASVQRNQEELLNTLIQEWQL